MSTKHTISIKEWIEGSQDYKTGLSILAEVCPNKVLLKSLSIKENAYNTEKLKVVLSGYANMPIPVKKEIAITETKVIAKIGNTIQKVSEPSKPVTQSKNLPVEVLAIKNGISAMMNKRGILSNSLSELKTAEERQEVIAKMDDITTSLNEARAKITYFEKNGELPPLEAKKELPQFSYSDDPALLKQQLLNLRSQRTKIKKKLDNPNVSITKKNEQQVKMDEVVNHINEIERRLAHG